MRAVVGELKRVDDAFFVMTGRHVDPLWTAPGGRTTARVLTFARACGYRHVQWTSAGFLGDELPSEQYPNQKLLDKALRSIRAGDILVMHLGLWSRQEPFHLVLEPLITGLQAKGLCFATLVE
jgi:peptidoglycan/xylan/chitin deacetylase (PgdA/CDA1 family)